MPMATSFGGRRALLGLAFALGLGAVARALRRLKRRVVGPDRAWWAGPGPGAPKARTRVSHTSLYLTMRDGVRIAADVHLPLSLAPGAKLPTVLRQTRYYRRFELRSPFRWTSLDPYFATVRRFVAAGYAWVTIDVRGTGASFGMRRQEWSEDEIRDGAEVLDWIVAQPWSNGLVAAVGISYEGTSAEMLASLGHPALRAVVPRFSHFDSFADIGYPGGLKMARFGEAWSRANRALDRGRLEELLGWRVRLSGMGVAAVDCDRDRSLLAAAIREHEGNYDLTTASAGIVFSDDEADGISAADISPYPRAGALATSGVPVYTFSGWYDGGNSRGAVNRYLTVGTAGSRLTLGPWPHAGFAYLSPGVGPVRSGFDHDGEILRFLDHRLKGVRAGIDSELPVHYYTTGEERWKASSAWPPPSTFTRFHFAPGGGLTAGGPADPCARDSYRVDLTAGSGEDARWDSMYKVSARYPDRAEADRKLLCYTSEPFEADLEVTGHPIVTLFVSSTATDGQFFVYLEDVAADGRVGYVAEGLLRALHRRVSDDPPYRMPVPFHSYRRADAQPLVPGEVAELRFDLLPLSHLFKRGHRIRVALAGADRDHCDPLSAEAPTLELCLGGDRASGVELPVIGAPEPPNAAPGPTAGR